MTIRFWRPDEASSGSELTLVACVASSQYLYVIAEGPSLPPPRDPWSDHMEMLWMHVTTASGVKLHLYGTDGGNSKNHGRRFLANFDAPPEPSEPLIVRLTKEDGTTIWEVGATPVG